MIGKTLDDERPPRSGWQMVFVSILIVQFMASLGFSVASPFVPLYVQELGVQGVRDAAIWSGIMSALGGITMGVASPIWGTLADHYGRKMMLVRATVGSAVVQAAMGFVANVEQLTLLRGVQGVVTGTVPAAMALAAATVPQRTLGFALGTLQTAVALGNMVGPFIGGWLAAGLGYRSAFYVTGALLLSSGVLCVVGVREQAALPLPSEPRRHTWTEMRAVFSMPYIPTLLGIVAACRMASGVLLVVVPLLLQEMAGGNPDVSGEAGTVIGLGAVAMAIGAAVWGRLGDRFGQTRVLLICLFAAAATALPMALVDAPWQLAVEQAVYMAAVAGLLPSSTALLGILGPQGRQGAIYGASGTALALGNGLGPALVAVIVALMGTRAVFPCLAVLLLLLFLHLRSALPDRAGVAINPVPSISE